MIPVKLKLSNFTSYGEDLQELDFTKFQMAVISGPNGAGKSSLLDAITWCIWGTSRVGDSADQLIHLSQSLMFVEFTFELDRHTFTIKRSRNKKAGGSTSLELLSGNHNLTESTIKATQQKIIDLLHLNYETFVNSSFLRQNHADEFTIKGPTDRKRILADILGLSHYDELEEKAKTKAKEIQNKLSLLKYQLLEIEAELALKEAREKTLSLTEQAAKQTEHQLTEVEKLIKDIEGQKQTINSKIQSLEQTKQHLEEAKKELNSINLQIDLKEKAKAEYQVILNKKEAIEKNYQRLQQLVEERKSLEGKRSELIKVKNELATLQKKLLEREDKRQKVITELKLDINKLETENNQLQQQVDHLKTHKSICPTCGQTIGQVKNRQIIQGNTNSIDKNKAQIKNCQDKIAKYKSIILPEQRLVEQEERRVLELDRTTGSWQSLMERINQLDQYSNLYLKLKQADTAVKTHTEAILDFQKILGDKQKQIDKEATSLKEFEVYPKQLEVVANRLASQEVLKRELSQKALELRGKVGEAKQLVNRATQLENLQKQKQSEKNKLNKERGTFEELALAFGRKGIQAMIIETAIPEIEQEANYLLDRLTEGQMRVYLQTQRETKAKEGVIETLDIIISDELGERDYQLYSGGEAFRVNLAIRLALSKLLTHRAGTKLQFLVIDEGFGTQDTHGISRIVEAINAIKDDFEKILIITHLDELKEEFPVRIEVSKGTAGSTFEIVST